MDHSQVSAPNNRIAAMARQEDSAVVETADTSDVSGHLGPGVTSTTIGPDGIERECTGLYVPRSMQFTDDTGTEHNIFMDLGTHERAYKLFTESNWEELKKFPKYEGQAHDYDRYNRQIDEAKQKKNREINGDQKS